MQCLREAELSWVDNARVLAHVAAELPNSCIIHESKASAEDDTIIRLLPDGEHCVKEGPAKWIRWEYWVYSHVQLQQDIEFNVCEHFVDGGKRAYMLLHRVFRFSSIFEEFAADPALGLPDAAIAWCAYSAIQAMRLFHEIGVLHRDIHPGNIGLTPLVPLHQLLQLPPGSARMSDYMQVVFIDYEWATFFGLHPDDMPSTRMWLYASDRRLLDSDSDAIQHAYSPADDLEALAYTLLALGCRGRLPWRDEIEAAASGDPWFGERKSDMEFTVQTRKKHLDKLCRRTSLSDGDTGGGVMVGLLEFAAYARGLKPDEKIDYLRWEKIFKERSLSE